MENSKQHLRLVPNKFSIIEELCQLSSSYNSNFRFQEIFSQLSEFEKTLQFKLSNVNNNLDYIKTFVNIFFQDFGFKCYPIKRYLSLEAIFLDQVLKSRQGPAELLLLFFSSLAKSIDIKIKKLNVKNHAFVKLTYKNECLIFDFQKGGNLLSKNDIIKYLNEDYDFETLWSDKDLLMRHLAHLKILSRRNRTFKYKILNILLKYKPFNLHLLSERAELGYELGHLKETVRDITNYLSFSPGNNLTSSKKLVEIYRRAKKEL